MIDINFGSYARGFRNTDFYRTKINHTLDANVYLIYDPYLNKNQYSFAIRYLNDIKQDRDKTLEELVNIICVEGTTVKEFKQALGQATKMIPWNTSITRFLTRNDLCAEGVGHFVDIDGKMISYVPNNRLDRVFPRDFVDLDDQLRVKTTIGRFLRRIEPEATDEQIENLVNRIKASFLNTDTVVEVVSGEDIRYWYHEDNYSVDHDTGDLSNSCMRYDECQSYLDIYTSNKNVSMMIARVGDQLVGRSLVWNTNKGVWHDRIYASGAVYQLMQEYAKAQGWKMCYGQREHEKLEVELDYADYHLYPYADSFFYLKDNKVMNYRPNKPFGYLQGTEGDIQWEEIRTIVEQFWQNGELIINREIIDDVGTYNLPDAGCFPNTVTWFIHSNDDEIYQSSRGALDMAMIGAWRDALRSGKYVQHDSAYHMKVIEHEDGRIERTFSPVGVLIDLGVERSRLSWEIVPFERQMIEGQRRSFSRCDGHHRIWPKSVYKLLTRDGYDLHFLFSDRFLIRDQTYEASFENMAKTLDNFIEYIDAIVESWVNGQDPDSDS